MIIDLSCNDNCNRKTIRLSEVNKMSEAKKTPEIQIKLPPEMAVMLDNIRKFRIDNFEPTSTKSIVIDAVKEMHSRIQGQQQ